MDVPFDTQGVSLRDVLALPALASCVVAAGSDHLDGLVRWVHCSDLPDIAYWLRGGELLIHTGVQNMGTSLLHLVRGLHEAQAAAVAIALPVSDLPRDALALADSLALPVISIPDEHRFVDITYEVGRLILTADALVSGKIDAFWSRVADANLSTSNMGRLLAAIAETLIWMPMALYDRQRKLITTYAPAAVTWPDNKEPRAVLSQAARDSFAIVPIEVGGAINGYLVFPAACRGTPGFDRLSRHAARAIGLALDVSIRVDDLRARWKSDLFARILESSENDWPDLELHATRAGLDLARRHRVVTMHGQSGGISVYHVMRRIAATTTQQLGIASIFHASDDACSLLVPAAIEPDDLVRAIRSAQQAFVAEGLHGEQLRVGVGRNQSGLKGILESARQADTAVRTAEGSEVAWYDELKMARILVKGITNRILLEDAKLRLQHLSLRERDHLSQTIEALIETNFNASEAAKRLGLHRNGLRERIARLSAKIGCDLREVAEVTSMWLALQVQPQSADAEGFAASP